MNRMKKEVGMGHANKEMGMGHANKEMGMGHPTKEMGMGHPNKEMGMGMDKEYGQPEDQMQQPADQQADMEAQFDQMAQAAPQPQKPFTIKVIDRMVKTINQMMSKLSDEDVPELTFDAGEAAKGGKFDQALPADVFITLVAITQLLEMVGGGEFADKYSFDPYTAVTDTDLRKMTAQIERMMKDKKFIAGIKDMTEGEEMAGDEGPRDVSPEMAPAPNEMTDEDEALASAMA